MIEWIGILVFAVIALAGGSVVSQILDNLLSLGKPRRFEHAETWSFHPPGFEIGAPSSETRNWECIGIGKESQGEFEAQVFYWKREIREEGT